MVWDRAKQTYWICRHNNTIRPAQGDDRKICDCPFFINIYDTQLVEKVCFAKDDVELMSILKQAADNISLENAAQALWQQVYPDTNYTAAGFDKTNIYLYSKNEPAVKYKCYVSYDVKHVVMGDVKMAGYRI